MNLVLEIYKAMPIQI